LVTESVVDVLRIIHPRVKVATEAAEAAAETISPTARKEQKK